jgi:thiol-disulfide isomerase/thioredoxin
MWRRLAAGFVAACIGSAAAPAQELNIGDPAPKLDVKEFVKGEAVSKFEKGKTYVVEFWATWCGPCKATIPHLTELQKKHKDITVIGVSVWEEDAAEVKPFVEKMGEKMDYRVAMDAVPAGEKSGRMAQTWMEAAGQEGIPAAFIINGDGKVAWIGHPGSMDKPLEQIVSGKYDLQAATDAHKKQVAGKRKMQELSKLLAEAQKSGDPKNALAAIDQAIAEEASMERQLGFAKFRLLSGKGGDPAKAIAYGKKLVDVIYKDSPQQLNMIAWTIVDPKAKDKPSKETIAIALSAAQRADAVAEGKDGAIADTLAKAYFDSGDAAKALEIQEKAIRLAKGTDLEEDKDMKARLEMYKKAVEKK